MKFVCLFVCGGGRRLIAQNFHFTNLLSFIFKSMDKNVFSLKAEAVNLKENNRIFHYLLSLFEMLFFVLISTFATQDVSVILNRGHDYIQMFPQRICKPRSNFSPSIPAFKIRR